MGNQLLSTSGAKLNPVPPAWHNAPRRWGSKLHTMCSYMAMFPPSIPHYFIRWLTKPGDVVYDPFCGRGTAPLEACLLDRVGLGSDANPLAWVLTAAKVAPPAPEQAEKRLAELRRKRRLLAIGNEPDHIRMLFSKKTLGELLWVRKSLDLEHPTDRYLMANLLGILHLNALTDGTPRGLTVAMPNTFAMAPNYVRNYIERENLVAPDVDVLQALEKRVFYFSDSMPPTKGKAWIQNALASPPRFQRAPKLIFTSPPYLQVMKYGKLNWIRLWLLNADSRKVDEGLFSSSSLPKYLEFMAGFLSRAANTVSPDGHICIVVGDVRKGTGEEINLAKQIATYSLPKTLRLCGIVDDSLPVEHKVSRIWGASRGRATRTDRIIVLGGPKAKRLNVMPDIEWTDVQ